MELIFLIFLIIILVIFILLAIYDKNLGFFFALIAGVLGIIISLSLFTGGYERVSGIDRLENATLDSQNNTITDITQSYTYESVKDNYTKILAWITLIIGFVLIASCIHLLGGL